MSSKTFHKYRKCRDGLPPVDNRRAGGIKFGQPAPKSDLVDAFLTHMYIHWAEDVSIATGWDIKDFESMPKGMWEELLAAISAPFGEMYGSEFVLRLAMQFE
jgi:hypothetical protein